MIQPKTIQEKYGKGQRIEQIRQDLKNKDISDRDKVLRYSEHLTWLLKKIEELYKSQTISTATHEKTPYMHGMANGIIMAMAIFLEDQQNPPYIKRPKQYKLEPEKTDMTVLYMYIEELEALLSAAFRADHEGPLGYGTHKDPWLKWRDSVLGALQASPATSQEMEKHRDRIREWMKRIKNASNGK